MQERRDAHGRREDATGVERFINARTDLFLDASAEHHCRSIADTRAPTPVGARLPAVFLAQYVVCEEVIAGLDNAVAMPVNVMKSLDANGACGSWIGEPV